MATQPHFTALLLAAALGACSELTADAPLFSSADQFGPPPLTEGLWIAVHEGCPESNARRRTGRFPGGCTPLEIRRTEDGAWQAQLRIDLIANLSAQERAEAEEQAAAGPMRLVIAPAVERARPDSYAPLYVAEVTLQSPPDAIGYAVIAPIGAMPAQSTLVVASIGCIDILRQGPIEGVREQYRTRIEDDGSEHREVSGCVASTQAAVREAARRAVIENLDEMLERRYVYVRPE
jgi:hypothetical protein